MAKGSKSIAFYINIETIMKSKINLIGLAVVLVGTVLLLKVLDGTLCFYWAIPTIILSGFYIF
jgi:hypothetical protein